MSSIIRARNGLTGRSEVSEVIGALSRAEGCWPFDARDRMPRSSRATAHHLSEIAYPSGEGRLSSVGLIWRDCAVVQTPMFAPVQETVRWQVSRYWLVLRDITGGHTCE